MVEQTVEGGRNTEDGTRARAWELSCQWTPGGDVVKRAHRTPRKALAPGVIGMPVTRSGSRLGMLEL
jgi:hypothetical protein